MICVDNYRVRMRVWNVFGSWSHLFSDCNDEKELFAFAEMICLKRTWLQRRESGILLHFDVTEPKRIQAIRYGAKPVTIAEVGRIIQQMKEAQGR